MPNPQVVSGNTNSASFTSGTSATVSSTGSVAAGNLMVVVLTVGGATAPSSLAPPSGGGWTTFLSTTANTGSGLIVTAIFYKQQTATGSFSGSFTWTTTATSGSWGFFVMQLQGALLVDGSVATSQNASGTKTSPSVTPGTGNVADTLIGCIIGAVVGTDSITKPAAMTSIINIAGTSAQPFFSIASLGLASASATGTETWTIPTSRTCLGVSFLIQQGPVWGWDNVGMGVHSPIRQSNLPLRRAAARTRTEFAFPGPFVPMGWEIQPPQPPRPATLKKEAVFDVGDEGIEAPLLPWVNDGWEIQPPPPRVPSRNPLRLLATKGRADFAIFTPFVAMGFEVQPPQPPHPRPERSGAVARGDDGIEAPFVPPVVVPPAGFDVLPALPSQRPRRLDAGKDDGIYAPFSVWRNDGWEQITTQPPHPRPERSGAIAKGDDGTEAPFSLWQNFGWPVQNPQPPHPRPERAGAIMRGDDGTEGTFNAWVNDGWEQITAQPLRPLNLKKGGIFAIGDGGISAPSSPFSSAFAAIWPQPPHPRPERAGILARGDDGTEGILYAWVNDGWEIQSVQPPRPIRRLGVLPRGDDGIEAPFVPPSALVAWGFEPIPPHLRANYYRGAAIKFRSEFAFPPAFVPYGWEVQAPTLLRSTTAQRGGVAGGKSQFASFGPWVNAGWELQNLTFPRPASWRGGAIARSDDGLATLQPPPSPPQWGWDIAAPMLRPRPRVAGVLVRGTDGIEAPKILFVPVGWQPVWADLRHIWRGGAAIARGDDGIQAPKPFFVPQGWQPIWADLRKLRFTSPDIGSGGETFPQIIPPPSTSVFFETSPPIIRPVRFSQRGAAIFFFESLPPFVEEDSIAWRRIIAFNDPGTLLNRHPPLWVVRPSPDPDEDEEELLALILASFM